MLYGLSGTQVSRLYRILIGMYFMSHLETSPTLRFTGFTHHDHNTIRRRTVAVTSLVHRHGPVLCVASHSPRHVRLLDHRVIPVVLGPVR